MTYEQALTWNDQLHERLATCEPFEREEILEVIALSEAVCLHLQHESVHSHNSLVDEDEAAPVVCLSGVDEFLGGEPERG